MKALFASLFLHVGLIMILLAFGVMEPEQPMLETVKQPWYFLASFFVFWGSFSVMDD